MPKMQLVYKFALAMLSPLVLWAFLAFVGRRKPQSLRGVYPWLRAFSWLAWSLPLVLFVLLLATRWSREVQLNFWLAVPFNGGIQLVRAWVQERVDPGSLKKSSDGWWPTPKNL